MNTRAPAILDHLAALADTTRSRILLLLDGHELTVTELCSIMQLPQSTVSRDLKALPIDDARLDAATLMLVLHHVPEPERALAELARVLKPGGRAMIVDMLPHERENYRQQMGHVWLGFSDEHMRRLLTECGFE